MICHYPTACAVGYRLPLLRSYGLKGRLKLASHNVAGQPGEWLRLCLAGSIRVNPWLKRSF